MTYTLNAFDQYIQLENRLTRALGVSLERSPAFRKAFIKKFIPGVRLNKTPRIRLQLADGKHHSPEEYSGIPDLALIDGQDNAIIIESKVGARLSLPQLEAHERRALRSDLTLLKCLAITGRETDKETLDKWKRKSSKIKWGHISWRAVYQLARNQPRQDVWANELADYMEIFASEMDDKGMDKDVRVIGFSGIPFTSSRDYDAKIAKRILRALVESLMEDKKFISEIGFKKTSPPVNRERIKNDDTVWDYLAPSGKKNHTSNHHFTLYLQESRTGCALTIPNNTFKKLKRYLKNREPGEFQALIESVVLKMEKAGVINEGGQPYICMIQRRYKGMTKIYAVDGILEFDLRTIKGHKGKNKEPSIAEQRAWIKLCEELIFSKKGNTQFQIGVRFPYEYCKAIKTPAYTGLIKKSFVAMMPFLKELD